MKKSPKHPAKPSLRASYLKAISAVAAGLAATAATAGPFTLGDLVIYRVGDGSAALGTTATAVFLDEYTTGGSLVQSLILPSSGAGALTAVGNATTEGVLSRAQNGLSLVFTGYRKDAGGTNPSSDAPATTSRVIATVDAAGTVNASSTLTDSTGTIRSATSVDGTSSFYVGTSTGVRYDASPFTAATTTVIDTRNSRQVNLSGNTLFAANGSTAVTGKVQSYGTLPTTATAATPIVTLASGDAVNGFALFDLSTSVAGDDTMYLLSTVENLLRKYTFDGTTWNASGSVGAGSAQNITGFAVEGTVNLFLTSGSTLYTKVDSTGYNAALDSVALTTLATAEANTAFRGIAFAPSVVPEPSSYLLLAAGGLLFVAVRRFRVRD